MNALDKANGDSRIQSLIKEVSSKVKVKYRKSKHDSWASNMEHGVATIWWKGCAHPSASFAHELLHIKLQLNGYKRIRVSFSNLADPATSSRLMECIDNEIQHHKFYDEFIAIGFKPDQFYGDSDSEIEEFLEKQISECMSSTVEAAIVFFSLIAPGGSLTDEAKTRIRAKLYALDGGKHIPCFEGIEKAIMEWSSASSGDATEYIKRVILSIKPHDNCTWYGFSKNARPANGDGVFVDQSFSVEEQ